MISSESEEWAAKLNELKLRQSSTQLNAFHLPFLGQLYLHLSLVLSGRVHIMHAKFVCGIAMGLQLLWVFVCRIAMGLQLLWVFVCRVARGLQLLWVFHGHVGVCFWIFIVLKSFFARGLVVLLTAS